MTHVLSTRVFAWRPCGRHRNGSQRTPNRGEKRFFVAREDSLFLFRWIAFRGLFLMSSVGRKPPHATTHHYGFPEDWKMPPKRRVPEGELPPIPALGVESLIFKKCPLLIEFCAATAYEDGSMRTPGYYTFRNRVVEYEVTVYDPDAGQRMPVRARTVDEVFKAVELFLGAENAPWEVDGYLLSQVEKNNRKKKVAKSRTKK